MNSVYYLGPLREHPKRIYSWSGETPESVGQKGEFAIAAILAASAQDRKLNRGPKKHLYRFDEFIAQWLKDLGIIESFPIIDKALKVKINGMNYDLEILDREIPSIIITHDAGPVYNFDEELYKLNLEKLNYEVIKLSEITYEGLLSYYYNPDNIYKFFKSREALNLFVKEYLLNNNKENI